MTFIIGFLILHRKKQNHYKNKNPDALASGFYSGGPYWIRTSDFHVVDVTL